MSSMGKAILNLEIADFNFSHTFVICNRILETDFLFGTSLQKCYSLLHNGTIPIKIKGKDLQDQVVYFISNQDTKKELNPTFISSMASTTSKQKQHYIYWLLITLISTSPLTKVDA